MTARDLLEKLSRRALQNGQSVLTEPEHAEGLAAPGG